MTNDPGLTGRLALGGVDGDAQHGDGGLTTQRGPEMVRIQGELVINRPVDEVFDFVADARNEPRYNPRILQAEKLTPGPIGVGTRFRDQIRSLRRPAEIRIQLTGYQRPRRLASSIHTAKLEITGLLTFDPVGAATRMRWTWQLQPLGALRLLAPLIGRLGGRQEQRTWASMKAVLEARQAPAPASGRS